MNSKCGLIPKMCIFLCSLGPDQDKKPDPERVTASSEMVTSLKKTKQDSGEIMPKVQDKDKGEYVPEENEDDGGMEEKVEAESVLTEVKTQAEDNAEAEEMTGKEEQPAESTAEDVELETTGKNDSLGNRSVKITFGHFTVLNLTTAA